MKRRVRAIHCDGHSNESSCQSMAMNDSAGDSHKTTSRASSFNELQSCCLSATRRPIGKQTCRRKTAEGGCSIAGAAEEYSSLHDHVDFGQHSLQNRTPFTGCLASADNPVLATGERTDPASFSRKKLGCQLETVILARDNMQHEKST